MERSDTVHLYIVYGYSKKIIVSDTKSKSQRGSDIRKKYMDTDKLLKPKSKPDLNLYSYSIPKPNQAFDIKTVDLYRKFASTFIIYGEKKNYLICF